MKVSELIRTLENFEPDDQIIIQTADDQSVLAVYSEADGGRSEIILGYLEEEE